MAEKISLYVNELQMYCASLYIPQIYLQSPEDYLGKVLDVTS